MSEYCQNDGDVGDRDEIVQDLCNAVDLIGQFNRLQHSLVKHLNWTNQAKPTP